MADEGLGVEGADGLVPYLTRVQIALVGGACDVDGLLGIGEYYGLAIE